MGLAITATVLVVASSNLSRINAIQDNLAGLEVLARKDLAVAQTGCADTIMDIQSQLSAMAVQQTSIHRDLRQIQHITSVLADKAGQ